MCGRYGFIPGDNFYSRYQIEDKQLSLAAKYNISPGTQMPIIIHNSFNPPSPRLNRGFGEVYAPTKLKIQIPRPQGRGSFNKILLMKWGLIPSWTKDPQKGYQMINARSESLLEKPSFRHSFLSKRCLIPASFFYEWKKANDKKIPYIYFLKNKKIFSFAGLYDIWKNAEDKEIYTYTIITTGANDLLASVHNRMPVILDEKDEYIWLEEKQNMKQLMSLLQPYKSESMSSYQVSQAVNNPATDHKELINKVN